MQSTPRALLRAYDQQLRTEAETPSATAVTRLGPLRLVTFPGGRGFVTYPHLDGADESTIRAWVAHALEHYGRDDTITRVQWKTRHHDAAPGLHRALVGRGFAPGEPESIMVGHIRHLAAGVPAPPGVRLRQVTDESEVRMMSTVADEAFGDPVSEAMAEALLHRLSRRDGMQLWVAEAEGRMVGAGRLEPVAGTGFAGIWGGAVLAPWRGRGIYRALTAVRARAALNMGKTLIHSDSTEYSRPILERAGLTTVSATTTYTWHR